MEPDVDRRSISGELRSEAVNVVCTAGPELKRFRSDAAAEEKKAMAGS